MPEKKTNRYLYRGDTRSTCPVCRQLVTARIHEKQNKLYLEKFCPEHGRSSALLSSDATWTEWSRDFNKPGEKPLKVAGHVEKGCPHDCGLCDDHEQHSCSIQIEVTDKCDLTCNNCYMGPENSWFLPYLFRCCGLRPVPWNRRSMRGCGGRWRVMRGWMWVLRRRKRWQPTGSTLPMT